MTNPTTLEREHRKTRLTAFNPLGGCHISTFILARPKIPNLISLLFDI